MLLSAGLVRADEAVQSAHAVVIAGHPVASQLGLKVLQDGGNAIDALVTVSLALGVAEPGNSGLGGKFVMTYFDAKTGQVSSVVAMDAAPLKTPVDEVSAASDAEHSKGWKSVCVPGLAAALGESHAKWGTRPWATLVRPVVKLARDGVKLNDTAADMLTEFPVKVHDAPAMAIYAPTGKTLARGEMLRNPDLANTLSAMADGGYRAFYTGDVAKQFVAASEKNGGYLSLEDFTTYKSRFLPALGGTYRGLSVYSSPPPLTGGTTLLACLKCLEPSDLRPLPPRQTQYIDLIGRVLRQVYPATASAAADVPDSGERVAKVLSPESIRAMVEKMSAGEGAKGRKTSVGAITPAAVPPDQRAEPGGTAAGVGTLAVSAPSPVESLADDRPDACTTHLIIVDGFGNIACVTQSLGLHFGSGVVAGGTGVLLNADVSNFGFTKGTANAIAPGKWPRSTMTPTIFLKDGKPVLAIGSPAGQRIPTAVLQVSLDVLDYGRDLKDAIRAPRFHVVKGGKTTNQIAIEAASAPDLETTLGTLGWQVERHTAKDYYFGSVNAVQWRPDGTLTGVADQRRTSDAAAE